MPKSGSMKAAVVQSPNKGLQFMDVEIPKPKAQEVLIRVETCGVCHSDSFTVKNQFPGIEYPIIPGHEVVGVIEELGSDAAPWKVGSRVGVGWSGYYCQRCRPCRQGDLQLCENSRVTGVHFNGGYAQYMAAPITGLASVPSELSSADAAPLLCAGVTTFNGIRHSGARPGDVVAVLGIGGLGHLAVQFSAKMGFHTVALSRRMESEEMARKLGARSYIAMDTMNAVAELQKLGGAKVLVATAPSGKLMSSLIDGLGSNGTLLFIAAAEDPLSVSALQLIPKRKSILGWASGVASDSEETMRFSVLEGIRPMIEKFPLEKAAEAYEKMMAGKVRYRAVLIP